MGGANQALGNWGDILNNQYQNQLGQYNANQSSSSGFGNILGMMGGMAMKRFGFQEGGAVPAEASPSGGGQQDDVPVAVSVGEFVVPRETVSWLGEKHFHKLIEKTAQERAEAQAVPTGPVVAPQDGVQRLASGGIVDHPRLGSGPDVGPLPGGPVIGIPDHSRPGSGLDVGPLPGGPVPGVPDHLRAPGFPDPIPVFPTPGPGIRPRPEIPGYQPPPIGNRPGPTIPGYRPPVVGIPRGEYPTYPTYPGYPAGPGWGGDRGVRVPLPAPTPHPWQDPRGVRVPTPITQW
jgi:hypothetical protein